MAMLRNGSCVKDIRLARIAKFDGRSRNFPISELLQKKKPRSYSWRLQKIDDYPGGSYPGARPFYEGTDVLAGCKVVKQMGLIEEYRFGFGIDDLILGIGHNGPAVLGLNWYKGMTTPDDFGFIRPTGRIEGGHCIACTKVDINREIFALPNSWGYSWGDNGYCHVTFKDMERLLKEDGEAVFFIKRKSKLPKQ